MIGGLFDSASLRKRGNRARDLGHWGKAADLYRRHLAKHPRDFAIWVQLGHMLSQVGDYGAADDAYGRAGTLNPHDPDLLLCWGHSRKLAGDLDGARRHYAASLHIDDNATARAELDAMGSPDMPGEAPAFDAPAEVPPNPPGPEDSSRRAWDARMVVVKPLELAEGAEAALFVTHSATGAIKPHVLSYVQAFASENIPVLLIVVADRQMNVRAELRDAVAGLIVRENAGFDFAAWAHALHFYPELYGVSTLYLVNDSVVGPADQQRFGAIIDRVRTSDADLVGLTESHEYRWHLQTFFLALKAPLLASQALHRFFDEVRILRDKDRVIQAYEVRFSHEVEWSGHKVEVLFPSRLALNPTLNDWRSLITAGFPFMKLLPLRGAFPELDITGWRETLSEAGFDVPLIDATIRAAEEQVPSDGDSQLYAHPIPLDTAQDRPLKVAFYGPWNYDNGLGSASRGIIAALRHAGVRLNLHPIKKPFHIHKPLAPAVDVLEFGGPADIAIVHLNPDSWFLLTDEQRRAVGEARKRIGYWVWEMSHIPPAWRHDFSSVDRIWSPSRYCAELFAAQGEAPVDVIPHPVPVLPETEVDRAAVLERLGLSAKSKVILFVFDGSSYLVRKNPAALVRAFSASGLAKKGWVLVLKTKHLMDRPDEGAVLEALAAATEGVTLIDRAMPVEELRALWAVTDIYASPHCSEGFGLTIAEAMAAGKLVVATDFGGSTDYLDAATGFPVKARPWTLAEDFGHYTKGGIWARIDEPALTAALTKAAADKSDRRNAARERIAAQLSYSAVGELVAASLRDTLIGPGASPRIDVLTLRFDRGTPFEQADFGEDIAAIPLTAAGSISDFPHDVPVDRHHWIAFAPQGSVAAPDFADRIREAARDRPDVSIFYADDVAAETEEPIDQLRLKPEFDITLLAAQDYIGAPLIVRASALAQLGGVRPELGTAAMADLLFRAHAAGMAIARIPYTLLGHVGTRVRATDADYRMMLANQPGLTGYDVVAGLAPDTVGLLKRFGKDAPPVTVIVPTARAPRPDGGTYIESLLRGLADVDWPMDKLTVLVGDDVAEKPAWATRSWPFALRRLETPRASGIMFNYAAKMNALWRAATTEQILFMNDDVQLLTPDWLRALQSFAVDEGVGGVGARLLFEDGTLQHAGMSPHGDGTTHAWIFRNRQEGSYQGWARTQREWSMVTGAVFATRRSLLEQVAGFDERFSLEFNDTDLCLRLRALGYRIVCTPFAEMIHAEKASRGERLPPGNDLALFRSKWKAWIDQDPAWHPRLRRDRLDATPQAEENAWYL